MISGILIGREPVLSVIIVTYHSAQEIGTCLQTIPLRVCDAPTEVIVVDNSPGDGTADLIHERFSNVRYIPLVGNPGFGAANNIGYEVARGEYILFLNPDTISNSEAYEHCLNRLRADPTIGMISPKLVMQDGEMDLACRRSIPTIWDGFCRAVGLARKFPNSKLFSGYNLTYLPDDASYEVGAINGAFMMCPRSALLRFGVFDEQFFMYGDDLDLCYRCKKAGYKIVYDGQVQLIHLKGMSSSREHEKMARAVFSANKQFYLKHFNPTNSRLVRWKYGLLFGAWERLALIKASIKGHKRAQPL